MRTIYIALVVAGVFIGVVAGSSSRTIAVTEAPSAAVYGTVQVAVPDNMKAFPAELVPLP
jgi:hypothetical protein